MENKKLKKLFEKKKNHYQFFNDDQNSALKKFHVNGVSS